MEQHKKEQTKHDTKTEGRSEEELGVKQMQSLSLPAQLTGIMQKCRSCK